MSISAVRRCCRLVLRSFDAGFRSSPSCEKLLLPESGIVWSCVPELCWKGSPCWSCWEVLRVRDMIVIDCWQLLTACSNQYFSIRASIWWNASCCWCNHFVGKWKAILSIDATFCYHRSIIVSMRWVKTLTRISLTFVYSIVFSDTRRLIGSLTISRTFWTIDLSLPHSS